MITAPPRGLGDTLAKRQARPMNGREISMAIENHVITLTNRLLNQVDLLSDNIMVLLENIGGEVRKELDKQYLLQKSHITYPKVGWNVKTRLEQLEDGTYSVNAEVELDLLAGTRRNLRFGESGLGNVIRSLEEEKIPTNIPDKDRQSFNLPVEAEYLKPDGTVGRVDINELKVEKRAARSVDVGRAAENRVSIQVPTDENGEIGTKEIMVASGESGQTILTPKDLPEVSLDDLVATPPPPPEKPIETALPEKGINKIGRPNVKFKK